MAQKVGLAAELVRHLLAERQLPFRLGERGGRGDDGESRDKNGQAHGREPRWIGCRCRSRRIAPGPS